MYIIQFCTVYKLTTSYEFQWRKRMYVFYGLFHDD
jgi:hypothetical protein